MQALVTLIAREPGGLQFVRVETGRPPRSRTEERKDLQIAERI